MYDGGDMDHQANNVGMRPPAETERSSQPQTAHLSINERLVQLGPTELMPLVTVLRAARATRIYDRCE